MKRNELGMSLIEVLISTMVLSVALLAVAMTMAQGISAMFMTQEQLIAKQKAREALESVFTARSTQNILYDEIRNTANGGIFVAGYQSLRGMGDDGIANTADDGADSVETIIFPGPDGMLGTADDDGRSLNDFERRVTISDVLLPDNTVDPDIRRITVEVRYRIRGIWRTVTVGSYISRFA
jgi:type II secretory pathway pseudopilin PulG